MKTLPAVAAAVLLLAGCQTTPPAGSPRATAQLQPTKGNKASGEASFVQVGSKIRVILIVQDLKPDQEHGLHIHEVGDCSSGDGMSAKDHFNPFGKAHGPQGSAERHAGDLPALKADKEGRARIAVEIDLVTLTAGPGNHRRPRPHRPRESRRLPDPAGRQQRRAHRVRRDPRPLRRARPDGGGAGRAAARAAGSTSSAALADRSALPVLVRARRLRKLRVRLPPPAA